MSAAENTKPESSTAEQHHGLELGDRLFNAHAVLRAVIHQLREVEGGQVSDAGAEVHDAGRALRLAAATVQQVAELLSCCQVIAESEDLQAELRALHIKQRGAIA
jgi:hypothetical protein